MNKKVLVISPKFFYFSDSIAAAFRKLGWGVDVLTYDSPVHPYDWKNMLRYKLFRNKEVLVSKGRNLFSREVQRRFDENCPDLVFVVNGAALLPNVSEHIRKSSKLAIWFFDSIRKYPEMKCNIPFADALFCYEQSDMSLIKEEFDKNALFLPQAADLSRYYKMENLSKKYDIVFAGDIWQSQKRQNLLQKVVKAFPEKKILIWGVYKPWYKGFWNWLTRERRDVYMNCNASSEVLNQCYNEARLVLNIHNEQQKDGANPKVYEIAATGSFQVCDSNPYVDSLFPARSVGLYRSDEECIELIAKVLGNTLELDAESAYQETIEKHSFENRITKVLSTLELL